jgi:hypothetical protein
MNKPLHIIQEKIGSIQLALLRYKHEGKRVSVQVRVTVNDNDTLHCAIADDLPDHKLINKQVVLIQKDHDNYMYIGGRISREAKGKKLLLAIELKKACWYIRKFKGSVSWLQEKCLYTPDMKLAS